jgi:hypothetical protein
MRPGFFKQQVLRKGLGVLGQRSCLPERLTQNGVHRLDVVPVQSSAEHRHALRQAREIGEI